MPISIPVDALGGGPGGPLHAPSPWTNFGTFAGYPYGGVVIGVPSGSNEGVGTLNVQNGIFLNGVPLSSLFMTANAPFLVPISNAAPTTPAPVAGQLYWNNVVGQTMIFNGTTWYLSNSTIVAASAPSNQLTQGQLYWDTTQQQLFVWNGSAWMLAQDPIDAGTF